MTRLRTDTPAMRARIHSPCLNTVPPRAVAWRHAPPRPLVGVSALLGLALLAQADGAWAADLLPPGATQQIEEISRQRVPVLPLPSTPDFGLRLQAPEKAAVPRAVEELAFEIKGVRVSGNTLFSQAEIDEVFQTATGPAVTLAALREAAEKLEARFRGQGYFLTRVYVPPQQVKDGIFEVQVIEGFLSAVYVDGAPNDALRQRIEAITSPLLNKRPIDLATIERALLLINDLPGVVGTSLLRQGADLGASEIVVTLASLPDSHLLTFNNTGSRTVGPGTIGVNSTFFNPFGRTGSFNVGLTQGGDFTNVDELTAFNFRYSLPVGTQGAIFSFGGLASNALPGGTIRALDIRALSESVSPRLRLPLLRTRPNSIYLDLGLAVNRSRTLLGGNLLTFDKTTVAEATLSWVQNGWGNGTTNASLSLFQSLPLFDYTHFTAREGNTKTNVKNEDFFKLGLSLTRIQQTRVPNLSVLAQVQGQWSENRLPVGEYVSYGGVGIGRGFDGGSSSGDKGIGGLLELRYDSSVNRAPYIGNLQFYAFVDGGRAFLNDPAGTAPPKITSNGFGVRFPFSTNGFMDVQVANAHQRFDAANRRDDPRILFSGVLRF
ncbi:MAG: ShlB/FhaC/HecB family hemolysin secretion/activation protein [Rhodocyclaceae bacterium]|nr:ShlB/FhaC/HecB family hemolysin secretion/activation protein [Rhodocyclaceae bacterium]